MPGKRNLRATNVMLTYNGDFTREEIRDFLINQGINVEMVVRNEDGHTHVHVIGGVGEKRAWNPEEFMYMESTPDITLQKHEGGKAGLYDYLLNQDSEPLYVAITPEAVDKTIKIRKKNERQMASTTNMDEAIEILKKCKTPQEVEEEWVNGELPKNRTPKVWIEIWTATQRAEMSKATKALEKIRVVIPVEFMPTRLEECQLQEFIFNFDTDLSMDFKDVNGRELHMTKKQILSIHGEPGVGKTPCIKRALEAQGIPYYMVPVSSQPLQWFDGYKGEPIIWCDDTVLGNPNTFLNILQADQLQIKGSYTTKDTYRTRWIISNNVSLRGQFRQYSSQEDKARIEAIMARTMEVMMYPNEELQAHQKQPYVFRGVIVDTREEFSKLCNGIGLEADEPKTTKYAKLLKKLNDGTIQDKTKYVICMDGIREKVPIGDKTGFILYKKDGSKEILDS